MRIIFVLVIILQSCASSSQFEDCLNLSKNTVQNIELAFHDACEANGLINNRGPDYYRFVKLVDSVAHTEEVDIKVVFSIPDSIKLPTDTYNELLNVNTNALSPFYHCLKESISGKEDPLTKYLEAKENSGYGKLGLYTTATGLYKSSKPSDYERREIQWIVLLEVFIPMINSELNDL